MEYRKFNRGSAPEYPRGERFPDRLELLEGGAQSDLSWLRNTERGAIVFVMSAGCEACDLNAAAGLMAERPELDYLLLAEAGDEEYSGLAEELAAYPCRIERCEISVLSARIPIKVIPFMIVLDREGLVIGSGLFNTAAHAAALARPLLRIDEAGDGEATAESG